MPKRWVIAALVVGLLAVGAMGSVVLAQEEGVDGDSPLKSFVSRVAAILGLEEAQVRDAFDQAAREMRDDALRSKLDALVASGRMTRAQADEYIDWYASRPDSIGPGLGIAGPKGFGHRHGRGRGGHGIRAFFKGLPAPIDGTIDPAPGPEDTSP